MFCPNCGEPTRPHARFCANCGETLKRDSAPTVAISRPRADATTVLSPADRREMADRAAPEDLPAPVVSGGAPLASTPAPTAPPKYKHKWYRPGRISFGVFALLTAVAYLVSLAGVIPNKENAYWYTARATGFIAYGVLTISVALGLVVSTHWREYTGPWLVAERLHPQALLLSSMFLSFHVVAILLLNFPPAQAFIPFTSDFDASAISFGIIAMYLMIVLLVSTYLIGRIGYRTWHVMHYAGLLAWFLALGHAARVGDDSGSGWATAFYLVGAAVVVVLLLTYLGTRVVARRRRPVPAGAG
jgi:hypothetical protein